MRRLQELVQETTYTLRDCTSLWLQTVKRPLYRADGSVNVLGVSTDTVESHRKFAAKFSLTFPLLSDEDHAVCEKYGVWIEKNMYGKKVMGVARTTFLIEDGVITKIFNNVKPEGHAEQVLAAI